MLINELKIMTSDDSEQIINLLERCKRDIFSHPEYLKLFAEFENNEVIYFYYGNENNFIIIPYFKRKIKNTENKFDLVSPWYYGGPVHNFNDDELLKKNVIEFKEKLNEYCMNNNIITQFQRLNPLLKNYKLYQDDPNLFHDRKIVYVDLTKDIESIKKEYTRHTRKNLNKAKNNELKVYSDSNFSKFNEIYDKSMQRKNAKKKTVHTSALDRADESRGAPPPPPPQKKRKGRRRKR